MDSYSPGLESSVGIRMLGLALGRPRLPYRVEAGADLCGVAAQEPGAGVRARGRVVSLKHRRAMARRVVAAKMCSGRAACRFLKLSRSTWRYRRREATSEEHRLAQRLRALSEKHPRYGYRRIAALLRREGWTVGKRHVQKLRRAEGLRVPPTKRKIVRRGRSSGPPTNAEHRGHVWTWDFISDATMRGGTLRMRPSWMSAPVQCQRLRSSVRYWMASITCGGCMVGLPARSAMVRETFRMRS